MLISNRYLRRHLVKLIIIVSLCVGLVLYFQLDDNDRDSYLVAVPQRQASQLQASRYIKSAAKHSSKAWGAGVTNRFQDGDHDVGKNVRVHRDSELQIMDGRLQHDTASNTYHDNGGQKDNIANNYNKEPQKFDRLSDKVESFDQDKQQHVGGEVQHVGGEVLLSRSEKDDINSPTHVDSNLNPKANHTVVGHSDRVRQRVMEGDKQLENKAYDPVPRRQLNDNRVLQSNQRSSTSQKSLVGGRPDIRIMPKHPSVPEGHALMVTCADVLVLARKKSSEEAMYMTFELPDSLSQRLKAAVHILVRPGIVTLRFPSIKKGHAGVYKCVAEDRAGNRYTYDVPVKVVNQIEDLDPHGEARAVAQRQRDWNRKFMMDDPKLKQQLTPKQFAMMKESKERKLAMMGMMDAYDFDYDMMDDFIEELRHKVGHPPMVNLTALANRGKFQQRQIDEFCKSRGFGDLAYSLPEGSSSAAFYKHMLLNDKTRTAFCFVPKVGCTNLKVLFFVVQGFIPLSQLLVARAEVNDKRLEGVQFQESFLNRNDFNKEFVLKRYFKFMMVRNPLHRLVSGYRSKVQHYPLTGLNYSKPHYNFLRKAIYLYCHPKEYSEYLKKQGKTQVNITFSDFIDYWLEQPDEIKFDDHFSSMFRLCQPCRARFNFYGNFKNFEEDAQVLVERINTRAEFVRAGYYTEGETTETLSPSYYAQLTLAQKLAVLKQVELDLDFYYHLFPGERDTHNDILGLDTAVSIYITSQVVT